MTNRTQQDAQLSHLSDDYIRNLEPENQRYDITLAQDFVISVLPNGIKTWAFIYDFQGRNRRKTLGVFPEMNFEDAKDALKKARASMKRMDEPTVAPNELGQMPAVLGGGKYIPKTEPTPFNWLRVFKILGALAVLAALAGATVLVVRGWERFSAQRVQSETTEPANAAPLPFPRKKTPKPQEIARDTPAPESVMSPSPSSTSGTKPASTTGTGTPTSTPDIAPGASTGSSTEAPVAAPASAATAPGSSNPTTNSAASSPTNTAGSSTTTPARARPVTTLTTTTKATAFGGRVSRSRLTSRVQDLEPTDTLGPEISSTNSGFTRVFYFTELREFTDGTVVHRWSLNGEVHEEVVLKVRKSWRWRTYSNKDLTPGLYGEWKTETIDATGKVLDTETFTYTSGNF